MALAALRVLTAFVAVMPSLVDVGSTFKFAARAEAKPLGMKHAAKGLSLLANTVFAAAREGCLQSFATATSCSFLQCTVAR